MPRIAIVGSTIPPPTMPKGKGKRKAKDKKRRGMGVGKGKGKHSITRETLSTRPETSSSTSRFKRTTAPEVMTSQCSNKDQAMYYCGCSHDGCKFKAKSNAGYPMKTVPFRKVVNILVTAYGAYGYSVCRGVRIYDPLHLRMFQMLEVNRKKHVHLILKVVQPEPLTHTDAVKWLHNLSANLQLSSQKTSANAKVLYDLAENAKGKNRDHDQTMSIITDKHKAIRSSEYTEEEDEHGNFRGNYSANVDLRIDGRGHLMPPKYVCGFAYMYLLHEGDPHSTKHKRTAYIDILCSGSKQGSELLAEAEHQAAEHFDAERVELSPIEGIEPFYIKHGYNEVYKTVRGERTNGHFWKDITLAGKAK